MTAMLPNLDDAEVLAALQELTAEIRETLSTDQREAVRSAEEARLALATLLAPEQAQDLAESFRVDRGQAAAIGRQVLATALTDPLTAEPAGRLVADPPKDDQMVALGGVEVAIVLGALVTLLQTKARVKVERKAGTVDFSIDVEKQAAETTLIDKLVTIVGGMFPR